MLYLWLPLQNGTFNYRPLCKPRRRAPTFPRASNTFRSCARGWCKRKIEEVDETEINYQPSGKSRKLLLAEFDNEGVVQS